MNMIVCVLPDLPYPLYLISGINLGHREWSHALILAIPIGIVFGILGKFIYNCFWLLFITSGISWCLHIFCDMVSSLTGPKVLLPFTDSRLSLPFHFLPVAEVRIGGILFNLICIAYEIGIFLILFYMVKKSIGIIKIFIISFLLCGSIRQTQFREYIWHKAPMPERNWYLNNLNKFSPLHFSIFIEPNPRKELEQ